ncbi:very short patch repair endonuclease [Croceivirga radicis]|uniref:Very short patch repair endonuclease n=1 Tax=Croceivirga radicis TaxID=1929488 RepID=A0A1V6LVI0_9FLAO|nr:very short patch repair endonuclease [Croceivirga radicis]OQD44192.1 very short patch repair endonuclease [Croceivirga radicis]
MTGYTEHPIKVPRFNEANGFYTTPERSRHMGKIKGKNTKPELAFRKALWHKGYRYRIDYKKLVGKPDIALKQYKTVIFIDGEFWHGKDWKTRKQKLKSNREFWIAKIERNIQRDLEVNSQLTQMGYTVFRFWQKEIQQNLAGCLHQITQHLELVKQKA